LQNFFEKFLLEKVSVLQNFFEKFLLEKVSVLQNFFEKFLLDYSWLSLFIWWNVSYNGYFV